MSDTEQTLDTSARQAAAPRDSAIWGDIVLTNSKKLGRNGHFIYRKRTERASKTAVSHDSITPALEEAQPPTSEEAYTPASEEAHTSASEEANPSRSSELDMDENKNDDDVISLFGGNDFDTDTDDLLEAIDESLRPSDSYGPRIKLKKEWLK